MLKYNGRIITKNDRWIGNYIPPIPENTIRLRYRVGGSPDFHKGTGKCIDSVNNIWDLTYDDPDWSLILYNNTDLLEIVGSNTPNVTNLDSAFSWCTEMTTITQFDTSNVEDFTDAFQYCHWLSSIPLLDTSKATTTLGMFSWCEHLEEVPLFDTSNATDLSAMFEYCTRLKHIPLIDTSKAIEVGSICYDCYKAESGQLALYQQMINQANPPQEHLYAFHRCGRDTTTGAAELAQIPSDWK